MELRLLVAFSFDQYSSSSTMRKPRELWQTGALLLGGQLQGGTSEVHPRDRVLGLPGWTRARPGCHRMESCQVCERVDVACAQSMFARITDPTQTSCVHGGSAIGKGRQIPTPSNSQKPC